jgi:hypothetical protein
MRAEERTLGAVAILFEGASEDRGMWRVAVVMEQSARLFDTYRVLRDVLFAARFRGYLSADLAPHDGMDNAYFRVFARHGARVFPF